MAGEFRVESDALASGAEVLEQAAQRLSGVADVLTEARADAELAAENGLVEGAILGALRAWLEVLDVLGTELRDDAVKLRACLATYRRSDEHASDQARELSG
jgi:hypothetical protein